MDGGKVKWGEIPADLAEAAAEARSAVVEAAAEGDDALTEKFLLEETLSDEEVIQGLREAILGGRIVPALCGCATTEVGISALQEFIATLAPSPDQRPGLPAKLDGKEDSQPLSIDPDKSLVAFVFKTVIDDYVGKLSLFKVLQGSMVSESTTLNTATEKT